MSFREAGSGLKSIWKKKRLHFFFKNCHYVYKTQGGGQNVLIFLAKSEARGAYSTGAYKKSVFIMGWIKGISIAQMGEFLSNFESNFEINFESTFEVVFKWL